MAATMSLARGRCFFSAVHAGSNRAAVSVAVSSTSFSGSRALAAIHDSSSSEYSSMRLVRPNFSAALSSGMEAIVETKS